jgi:hypothetical protein
MYSFLFFHVLLFDKLPKRRCFPLVDEIEVLVLATEPAHIERQKKGEVRCGSPPCRRAVGRLARI